MFQELQIFCICTSMYVFGCRLSLFRLCDNDFGIIPVDGITNGITLAYYYYYYYYYYPRYLLYAGYLHLYS